MRQAQIHVPARSHRMCEAHSHLLGQVLSCQPSDAPSSSHRMRQFLNHRGAAIGCAKLTSMYQLTSNVLSSQPSVGPSSVADQLHFLIADDLHFLVADELHFKSQTSCISSRRPAAFSDRRRAAFQVADQLHFKSQKSCFSRRDCECCELRSYGEYSLLHHSVMSQSVVLIVRLLPCTG